MEYKVDTSKLKIGDNSHLALAGGGGSSSSSSSSSSMTERSMTKKPGASSAVVTIGCWPASHLQRLRNQCRNSRLNSLLIKMAPSIR